MRVYTHLGGLFVDVLVQSPSADIRKSLYKYALSIVRAAAASSSEDVALAFAQDIASMSCFQRYDVRTCCVEYYWLLLLDLAKEYDSVRCFFNVSGMIYRIMDMHLGYFPAAEVASEEDEMAWDAITELLATLVCSCWPINPMADREAPPPTLTTSKRSSGGLFLDNESRMRILNKTFYVTTLHHCSYKCAVSVSKIIAHVSYGWDAFSQSVVQVLLGQLKASTSTLGVAKVFAVTKMFFAVYDSRDLVAMRISEFIFSSSGLSLVSILKMRRIAHRVLPTRASSSFGTSLQTVRASRRRSASAISHPFGCFI